MNRQITQLIPQPENGIKGRRLSAILTSITLSAFILLFFFSLITPPSRVVQAEQILDVVLPPIGEPAPSIASIPVVDGEQQEGRQYGAAATTETPSTVIPFEQVKQVVQNSSLMFIENVGQFDDRVRFQVQGSGAAMHFTDDAIWLTIVEPVMETLEDCENLVVPCEPDLIRALEALSIEEGPRTNPNGPILRHVANLQLSLAGANPHPRIVGFDPLPATMSYIMGHTPDEWYPDVPVYAGIRYEDVFPGIDIEYTSVNGRWQSRIRPKRWADPSPLQWQVEGANSQTWTENSLLHLETDVRLLTLPFLTVKDIKTPTQPKLTARDSMLSQLLLPPSQSESDGLVYSTFLGGNGGDSGQDIAIDSQGAMYVTGYAASSDFTTTVTSTYSVGTYNVFVAKFDNDGDLSYSTLIGGDGDDYGWGIAVDDSGAAYVTGETASTDFPTTTLAYQGSLGGNISAFVAKLSSDGTELIYSTYLGGSYNEWEGAALTWGKDIDVDNGAAYVTGYTNSDDISTTPQGASAFAGGMDVFVAGFITTGSQLNLYTYLGGTYSYDDDSQGNDFGEGIVVSGSGEIYVTGGTSSYDFPTTPGAFDTTYGKGMIACQILEPAAGECLDAFVAKITATTQMSLAYSTYLGGDSCCVGTVAWDIDVNEAGKAFVVGTTEAADFNFPADANGYTTTLAGGFDAFVAGLNADGSDLDYFTYLGGDDGFYHYDFGYGIAVDNNGMIYSIGYTDADDFPTTPYAFQTTPAGNTDVFVTKLDPSQDGKASLLYSTYFGGSGPERGYGIAVDASETTHLVGFTNSSDFPTTTLAFQPSKAAGGSDAFLSQLGTATAPLIFFGQDWGGDRCLSSAAATQEMPGGINTRTGNFSHSNAELCTPGSGEQLDFKSSYASDASATYTTTMGYGWVHNYDFQLHFGVTATTHTVIAQAPGGSRFPFVGNGDGTYEPYAGVMADLVRTDGASPEDTEYVLTTASQHHYSFDADGQLTEQEDPFGNIITFTYSTFSGNERLYRATQESRYLEYDYDANGRLIEVSDNSGRTSDLGYDANGDLIAITDTLGLKTTYQYSGTTHLLTKVIDPSGRTLKQVAYDSDGRAQTLKDGNGNLLVDLDYVSSGGSETDLSATSVVTASGVVMTHTYRPNGVLDTVTYTCVDSTAGCQAGTDVGYDFNFRLENNQDANGNSTSLSWNTRGSNLEQLIDALGYDTGLSYDSLNNLTQVVNAQGLTTTYGYHNGSFPTFRTHMTDTLGNVTVYTPTVLATDGVSGFLKSERDPNGNVTEYTYNTFGQVTQVVQAAGTADAITTAYGYDAVGRLITSTQTSAGESLTSKNVYDDGDRLIATIANWDGVLTWQNCSFAGGPRDENICTLYGYDDAGRTISTTNALGQTSLTFYDDAGRVVTSVINYDGTTGYGSLCTDFTNPDPEENLCSLTGYDQYGRVVTTTDSLGHKTVTEYDVLGRVSRTVVNWVDGVYSAGDPDGDIETKYEYDAVGNTIIVTDTLGRMSRTFYDVLNRVRTTVANWQGSSSTITDTASLSNCFSPSLPDERDYDVCTYYEYDAVGNTAIVIDGLGRMARTFYDELNWVEATVNNWKIATLTSPEDCVLSAGNENDENICTLYGYDDAGRQITTTNALNQTSLTVYGAANRPAVQVANWDGSTTITTSGSGCADTITDPTADENLCAITGYDDLGRRFSSTDPLSHTTSFTYDGLGRLITTTRTLDGQPVRTVTSYDALGNRLGQTDAEGNSTSFSYDSLNRLVSTTSDEGVVVTQTYNAAGWVLTTTNGLGHQTVTGYDELGRRISTTDAENNTTQYVYDALGNQTAMVDAEGITTTYEYDDLNRLVQVIENDVVGDNPSHEADVATQYVYDALGNRLVITNALGYTATLTTYDALNRPIVVEDALGNQTHTQYNSLGYRVTMTDANEAVTEYSHDSLNRLSAVAYLSDAETVSYTYDAVGNRLVMTDGVGVTSYQYDALYRLITVTNPFTGTVGYGYDLVGNRTRLTYPDGEAATYSYDGDSRLIQVSDWNSGTTTYTFDAIGRLTTTTLPNGVVTVNDYDDAGRLINLEHKTAADELLSRFEYLLDGLGNRVQVTETFSMIDTVAPTWSRQPPLTAGDAASGDQFGFSVAVAGNTAILGAPFDDDNGNNSGSAYIFVHNGITWTQQAKLIASDGAASDEFGYSVDVSGDTVVVGAHQDDDNGNNSGSGYIFTRSGATWTQQTKLIASDGASRDDFGYSVAIDGDTVVVGAWTDDDNGKDSGSAYVFTRSGTTWTQQTKLTPGDGAANDWFGHSVALDDNTALIGAYGDDDNGSASGSAYVFTRSGTAWSERAKIKASDGAAGDNFGARVSIKAGVVAAGASGDDDNGSASGSAYIFARSGISWTQQAKITAGDGAASDEFGFSVAASEDAVVVGAHLDDDSGSNSGSAYVFVRSGTTWTQQAKITDSDGASSDEFGYSVSTQGASLLIGAPLADTGGAGIVYIREPSPDYIQEWTAELNQAEAEYGYAASTAGDVNGDGYDDVLVGARFYDHGQVDEGWVDLYLGSASGLEITPTWSFEVDQASAELGFGVNTAGDVNGDGYDDIIVGARSYTNGQANEGQAYLFYGSSTGLTTTVQWVEEGNNDGARFGHAVASAGDVNNDGYDDVIVGARGYSNGQNEEGRAYVYLGSSAGLSTTAVWTQESDVAGAWYGYSVASAGDVDQDGYGDIIVGACLYSNGESQEGAAYVYPGSASGPLTTAHWQVESNQAGADMGCGTGVSGVGDVNGDGYDDVLVGAQDYSNGESLEGKIFLYLGSANGLVITPTWTAESNSPEAAFGWALGAPGDVNQDGYDDFLVGADEHDVGGIDRTGRVFLYYGGAVTSAITLGWTADGTVNNGRLGTAVGPAGDVNGDGTTDLIVGEKYYTGPELREGRGLAYYGLAPDRVQQQTVISYAYDPLYRLVAAVYTGSITATYGYVYDEAGNMTAYTETVAGQTKAVIRDFDPADRLESSYNGTVTTTYGYDGNGNLIDNGTRRYGYDQRNMLITSTVYVSGTGYVPLVDYIYDGAGNRLQQVDYSGATTRTITYTNDILGLVQVLAADDGTDQTRYLFGLDLIYQDDGAETRYLLSDGLGSVRTELISDTVEAVTTYSPYGNLLARTGGSATVYGFTGEQYDTAIDLLFLRARYYDPYLNRFLSADNIALNANKPQRFHPYAYGYNNPANYVDPSGHCGADTTHRLETRGALNSVYVVIGQDQTKLQNCIAIREQLQADYWWTVEGEWYLADVQTLLDTAKDLEGWFSNGGSLNPPETIRAVFGGTKFQYARRVSVFRWPLRVHHVWGTTVVMLQGFSEDGVLHELGHVLDNVASDMTGFGGSAVWPGGLSDMYADFIGWRGYERFPFRFWCPPYERGPGGEIWVNAPNDSYHTTSPSEDFAQAFKESVLNHVALEQNAPRRANFMRLMRSGLVDYDD